MNAGKIGALTAGSDCPGLNAVIGAVAVGGLRAHRDVVSGVMVAFAGGEISSVPLGEACPEPRLLSRSVHDAADAR